MAKTTRPRKAARKATRSAARKAAPRRARAKASPRTSAGFSSAAIGLTADDVEASMAWYGDVLGFSVRERWEQNGVLVGGELVAGRAVIYMGQDDWKKGRDRVKGVGVRLHFQVNSAKAVDQLAAKIQSRGGTLASGPKDDWGMRAFDLVDPTGYRITVSSERT